jgi:hypothetical protein
MINTFNESKLSLNTEIIARTWVAVMVIVFFDELMSMKFGAILICDADFLWVHSAFLAISKDCITMATGSGWWFSTL